MSSKLSFIICIELMCNIRWRFRVHFSDKTFQYLTIMMELLTCFHSEIIRLNICIPALTISRLTHPPVVSIMVEAVRMQRMVRLGDVPVDACSFYLPVLCKIRLRPLLSGTDYSPAFTSRPFTHHATRFLPPWMASMTSSTSSCQCETSPWSDHALQREPGIGRTGDREKTVMHIEHLFWALDKAIKLCPTRN